MSATRFSRRSTLGATVLPLGASLAACAQNPTPGAHPMPATRSSNLFANPSKNEWPERFHRSTDEVQEAYRFALAHPEVLQYMPCYCGCIDDGHTSNKDCFIIEARADGSFMLEPMSFG